MQDGKKKTVDAVAAAVAVVLHLNRGTIMSSAESTTDDSSSDSTNNSDSTQFVQEPAIPVLGSLITRVTEIVQEGDHDKAPKRAVLPTGTHAGRVIFAGTVIDTLDVSNDDSGQPFYRMEVNTRDGETVYTYAGQYSPEMQAIIQDMESPALVVVVGKVRTYEQDDRVLSSVTPESIQEVDPATVASVTVDAADRTLDDLPEQGDDELGGLEEAALDALTNVTSLDRAALDLPESEDSDEGDGSTDTEEEAADDTDSVGYSEAQLKETFEHSELRGFGSQVDDVNGNGSMDELASELANRELPAPVEGIIADEVGSS